MTTKLEHTSEPTASGFWVHALDCLACLEQDAAEARQADLDAEEGYRLLDRGPWREAINDDSVL